MDEGDPQQHSSLYLNSNSAFISVSFFCSILHIYHHVTCVLGRVLYVVRFGLCLPLLIAVSLMALGGQTFPEVGKSQNKRKECQNFESGKFNKKKRCT